MRQSRLIVLIPLLVLALTLVRRALPHKDPAPGSSTATAQLGQVNFPTSCTTEAQPQIETGVALLHSFQYQQADQSFSEAAKRDPKCAMAHWGKALTHYEQLWEFPNKRTLQRGLEDVQEAQKLTAASDKKATSAFAIGSDVMVTAKDLTVTQRERGYISAAAAFYRADEKLSETQRVQAFSAALAALHKQFPDDVNASAFYALSLIALAEQQEVDATANRKAAIAILEPLCHSAPANPGPAHYLIHASDTSEFAAQGLDAARAYSKIAPDSSHALHMPSHIFVRLGLWQESISSNIVAAASAAKATEEHRGEPHYQFHALDFLNYSYLQSGQESKARQMVKDLENVSGASQKSIAEHQAWLAARNAFELHRWKEAAELPIPHVPPDSQESTYRVRAIGAARFGNASAARQDLQKYVEISTEEKSKSSHHSDKPSDKSVGQLEAEAWIAVAEGKTDDALKMLRSAADREDTDGVDSLAMPAREMLADMLLELKRPAEALTEYRAALKNSPNRFDSLYGAGHAAQMAGDSAGANAYFTKLMEISAPTADRAELTEAKTYLATASKSK